MRWALLFLIACLLPGAARADGNTLRMRATCTLALPLDCQPSGFAAAAFAVRKVRSAYTGNDMVIRRASDNATQTLGFVNGNLDTATASTFCAATTCFVTTWYDQSGNACDATDSTAANQPSLILSRSSLNNRPTLGFTQNSTTNNLVTSCGATSNLFVNGGEMTGVYESPSGGCSGSRSILTIGTANTSTAMGVQLRCGSTSLVASWVIFNSTVYGSNSAFSFPSAGTGGLVSLIYRHSATANLPAFVVDGTTYIGASPGASGSPTGESGANFYIGSGGTYTTQTVISEAYAFAGSAPFSAAMRANTCAYYGLTCS